MNSLSPFHSPETNLVSAHPSVAEGEKIYRMVAAIIGLKFLTIGRRPHYTPPGAA